jgi:hypothetical protein
VSAEVIALPRRMNVRCHLEWILTADDVYHKVVSGMIQRTLVKAVNASVACLVAVGRGTLSPEQN